MSALGHCVLFSRFDLRHSLTAALTYELPVRPPGGARWLGGWAIDSLVRAQRLSDLGVAQ